jgi:hypothetical protein
MNDPTRPYVGQMVLYWETDTECSPAVVARLIPGHPGIVDLTVLRAEMGVAGPPCRTVTEVASAGEQGAWGNWTLLGAPPGGS